VFQQRRAHRARGDTNTTARLDSCVGAITIASLFPLQQHSLGSLLEYCTGDLSLSIELELEERTARILKARL
jgi:hypothetical protein